LGLPGVGLRAVGEWLEDRVVGDNLLDGSCGLLLVESLAKPGKSGRGLDEFALPQLLLRLARLGKRAQQRRLGGGRGPEEDDAKGAGARHGKPMKIVASGTAWGRIAKIQLVPKANQKERATFASSHSVSQLPRSVAGERAAHWQATVLLQLR